jgi:hypothetical protein
VCRTGERCHVRSDLGNQTPGCDTLYAWHRDPASHSIGQLLMLLAQLFQPGIKRLDLGFEEPKLTQQTIQQEPMVIANAAFER